MTTRAIVVGAGIGGLAAAIHLRNSGWDVEVRERAPEPRGTGTAVGLWPGALQALDTLGVGATTRARARAAEHGGFLLADGGRIGTVDMDGLRRRTGDGVHVISRPALLETLTSALETHADGITRYGEPVTDVRELTDCDVVIAADGLNSPARTVLFGDAHRPRYSGVTAWHGSVDLDSPGMTETWGHRARFGVTPRAGGQSNWFACVPVPEGEPAPRGDLAELRARFGGWHPGVRRVLDRLVETDGGEGVRRDDLYDLAKPLPSYVSGTIALVGDAAHAMTPDLGRGACEALVDGVTLARALTGHARVTDALAHYDAARRRPTQQLARAARMMNRAVHTPRRVAPLRNAAMRLFLAYGKPPA
ncbi:2-polyprenyl-6-methoxyphenol hydroxylase [Streptomyces sp. AJS327]|uniref:FAD-dependent monooxygenase n=1 Tax=Streptomyces sp. AJS327 TaxID=2545265 RepID=UPI0015DFB192|nr:FAD-dependent monooxygenase [Streptomyces sp. AJS327]MBA0049364.1 2-polyprenyl-6-methoxyphenol hydroxylase [Streptomyces sp. AJS327]